MTISITTPRFSGRKWYSKADSSLTTQTPEGFGHRGIPMLLQQFVGLLALLMASPVLLVAAILIRLESRGPIFFSQVRVGEHGRRFTCYKLRSMYLTNDPRFRLPQASDSDRQGVCKKFFNDPRITCVGRFIRKFSIDELPQLFNIVRGDMALVGPRPHLVSEFLEYDQNILPRLFCKPGLTGLWQVSGRADTDFEQQLSLDKSYIKRQSIWFDVKILFATIPAVILAKGAY